MKKINTEKKSIKCIWNLGYDCEGEVRIVEMFDKQISVPICDAHLDDHKQVVFLFNHGKNIEEIMTLTKEEREKLFNSVRGQFPNDELTL